VTGHRRARLPAAVATCVVVLLAIAAPPALAAILGRLSPSSAQAGEWVELTTDAGVGGQNVYADLAASGALPLFLQGADSASAGNACDTPIGDMTWTDGRGTLRFQVPAVPPGAYWVTASVQGACWRFGDRSGVLTLTVTPGGNAGVPLPLVGAGVAAAAAAASAALQLRRRRAR